VFRQAAKTTVINRDEREKVLEIVSGRLGITKQELEDSLYADLEQETVLTDFNPPSAEELVKFYNYSLVITLLTYAQRIEARHLGKDEYLVTLAKSLGHADNIAMNSSTKIIITLKKTNRINKRSEKIDSFFTRLIENEDWIVNAEIKYLYSKRKASHLKVTQRDHKPLLKKDPLKKELIIEIGSKSSVQKKMPKYGEIIVLEDLARKKGTTESDVLAQIQEENINYRNLGGVLVTPKKYQDLISALDKIETLGEATQVLKLNGVRNYLTVLESMGYLIEWYRPKEQSRIYRLQ
jgi:hypothetical protein